MNDNLKMIHNDLLLATVSFAKEKSIVISIAYFISILMIILGFAPIILGSIFGGFFNIGEHFRRFEQTDFIGFFQGGGFIVIFLFLFTFIVLLWSIAWFINFSLLHINDHVLGKDSNVSRIISKSVSLKSLSTIGVLFFMTLLNSIIYLPIFYFLFNDIGNEIFLLLFFLLSLVFQFILNLKFCLAFPFVLFQDKNVLDALFESFHSVSFLTAFKYMFILLLVFIGIGTIFFIINLIITGLLSMIGFIGPVLNFILQIFINGFLFSLIFSFIISLYYDLVKPSVEEKVELDDNIIL